MSESGVQPHILVVDDARDIREPLVRYLRESGYRASAADGAQAARRLMRTSAIDLVILDIMMPGEDGLSLCRSIRENSGIPVIILTARGDELDRIVGLEVGADDYVSKPFDLGEFLARAKALVRRGKGQRSPVLSVADLQLNTVERTVRRGQKEIALVPMEYRVLEYLAHRPRAVISKSELLEHLYDYNWEKFSNVIEVYI